MGFFTVIVPYNIFPENIITLYNCPPDICAHMLMSNGLDYTP
jgi:hypothetical protein